MATKDWIKDYAAKKSVTLLEILRSTSLLRKAIEINDQEGADQWMLRRESLLSELGSLDEKLKGHATDLDDEFLKMLRQIQKMDAELIEIGTKGREMILNEVLHSSRLRVDILTRAMVEPKGNSLSVKV